MKTSLENAPFRPLVEQASRLGKGVPWPVSVGVAQR